MITRRALVASLANKVGETRALAAGIASNRSRSVLATVAGLTVGEAEVTADALVATWAPVTFLAQTVTVLFVADAGLCSSGVALTDYLKVILKFEYDGMNNNFNSISENGKKTYICSQDNQSIHLHKCCSFFHHSCSYRYSFQIRHRKRCSAIRPHRTHKLQKTDKLFIHQFLYCVNFSASFKTK